MTSDEGQLFLLKMAKKFCRHMTGSTLVRMHFWLEKLLDDFLPEWRSIPREKRKDW